MGSADLVLADREVSPLAAHGDRPAGPSGAVAHMDALCDVFRAWREARPDLVIAYTSGSNPSPFWLLHADYLWRGGADYAQLGAGDPFDRYATFVDAWLQEHRSTAMPMSAVVTFDLISRRMFPASDEVLRRGFWWLAGRTSLNHDWYLHPDDLTIGQWKMLAEAAQWARRHSIEFRYSRMIGGDVRKGDVYGFATFDGHSGTLALRNPSAEKRSLSGTLADWLDLSPSERRLTYRVEPVFGTTASVTGSHGAEAPLTVELPGLQIAIVEVGR